MESAAPKTAVPSRKFIDMRRAEEASAVRMPTTPPPPGTEPWFFRFGYIASSFIPGCGPDYGLITVRVGSKDSAILYTTVGGKVTDQVDPRTVTFLSKPQHALSKCVYFPAATGPAFNFEENPLKPWQVTWNNIGNYLVGINLFGICLPKPPSGGLVDINVSLTPAVPLTSVSVFKQGEGMLALTAFGPTRPDLPPQNGGTYPPYYAPAPWTSGDVPPTPPAP